MNTSHGTTSSCIDNVTDSFIKTLKNTEILFNRNKGIFLSYSRKQVLIFANSIKYYKKVI